VNPQPVLCVCELTIRYGSAVAVDGLSLDVQAGEVYGLLGPNGSGKSSTLSAIAGTLRPATGTITVQGIVREREPGRYLSLLGIVPQELALYEELSVADNLSFFGRLYGVRGAELRRRVAESLEFVQLTEHGQRLTRTLSGGMQRRLNLACALLHRPTLLLLDEPTVGLDLPARETLFESLRELRCRGCALVFSTHHLEEAEQLCDRIGLMDQGRLIAEGTLDQLDVSSADRSKDRPRLERIFLERTGRSAAAA
jgi:ABC-2 type transport system ATP-binding protein